MKQQPAVDKSKGQGTAGTRKRSKNSQMLKHGAVLAAGAAALTGNASAATIVVNSLADNTTATDGLCTLREASANANSNSDTTGGDCVAGSGTDTIDLTTLTGTITLGGTQLTISGSTTITGPGPSALTIDANNLSRVFYIYNNASSLAVTISGLTLTRGRIGAGRGSVISNKGENVTLSNVTINSSRPTNGVIAATSNGPLTIQNSTISGNTGGSGAGGIYVLGGGSLSVSGSTISGNTSARGAGLMVRSSTNPVTITNTNFTGNTATSGKGGGIFLYTIGGAVTISGSTVSGNTTANRGGGISLYKLNAALTISDTTISGNTSTNHHGGGFSLYKSSAPGTITIQRSTISGNQATGGNDGGGLFLYKSGSAITLENTTVSGNTANSGAGINILNPSGGNSLTIRSSTLAFNTAASLGGNINGGNSANTINVTNSIIAGGSASTGPDIRNGAATINLNYSLLQSTSGATIGGANNLTGVSPALIALANNGGATQTHAVLGSSLVVNAGDPSGAGLPATDQRGLTRIVGVVDMGAFELQAAAVTPAPAKPIPNLTSLPSALGISNQLSVLDLIAGQGPVMTSGLQDAARAFFGADATYLGQTANGSARISQGGRILSFYAIDANSVSSTPPALVLGNSNSLDVGTGGGTFTIVPAMYNLTEFGAALNAMGLSAQINRQGVIAVFAGDTIFVGRPDYVVTPGGTSPAGLVLGTDGLYRFTDSAGFTQVLRPAFLDTDGLTAQLPAILGNGSVTIQTDGSAWYSTYAGQQYVLVPDMSLTRPSQANAANLWWQDGINHFQFRSSTLVHAQGFTQTTR